MAPKAPSIPAPPSFVPLPPSPTITVRAPASIAAATSSPTPAVPACSARSPPVSWLPHACALSTYAVSPTSSTVAGTVSSNGPETDSTSSSPPSAALSTSTKPGPPSDIGARSISSSGACRRHPVAIASAASTALSVPANLSGATNIRMRLILADA